LEKVQESMSSVKGNIVGRPMCTVTDGMDSSLLIAEISFWQEMIKFRSATTTVESLERMQQALALAQSKLKNFSIPDQTAGSTEGLPAGNVYFLERRTIKRKS
jgi:hypothetical protein